MPDQPTGTQNDGLVAMEASASRSGIAGSDPALDRLRQAFTLASRSIDAVLSPHP